MNWEKTLSKKGEGDSGIALLAVMFYLKECKWMSLTKGVETPEPLNSL